MGKEGRISGYKIYYIIGRRKIRKSLNFYFSCSNLGSLLKTIYICNIFGYKDISKLCAHIMEIKLIRPLFCKYLSLF